MTLNEVDRGTAIYRITWIDATEEIVVYKDDVFWGRHPGKKALGDIVNLDLLSKDKKVAEEMIKEAELKPYGA